MTRSLPPHRCPVTPVATTTYSSFLQVDGLLSLQTPAVAHDQLLFVVIHQSHELWFKLLLHELDLTVALLGERSYRAAITPLRRINQIVRSLIAQWDVLDTMSPRGYLEFREALESGSGFQSAQFREIEFTAGLPDRGYLASPWLTEDERTRLQRRLNEPTLRQVALDAVAASGQSVVELLRDPADGPLSDLVETLVDFDELFALWRSRHVLAVERQIGAKPGTGSSSGVEYLRSTAVRRFFPELWDARSVL
jgi:tryptophan 2,3-dioxygenase